VAHVLLRGRLASKFLSLYKPKCRVPLGKGKVGAVRTWLPRKTEAGPNDLLVDFDESVIDEFTGKVRRQMLLLRTAGRKEEEKRDARRATLMRGEAVENARRRQGQSQAPGHDRRGEDEDD
jgi:hypothetical protein